VTYFNQTAGKEGSTTLRPLAKVKNFLSTLIGDSSLLSQFVQDDRGDLTERAAARDNMMAEFQETATEWNGRWIQSSRPKPRLISSTKTWFSFW